jgi:hypothetical protein
MQKKNIVLVALFLTLCIATMALVTRLWLPKHSKLAMDQDTDTKAERQPQVTQIPISLKRLFIPRQGASKAPWVPNISAILKAGDEGLISCALFASLQEEEGQAPLDTLYHAFANEIRARHPAEKYPYAGDVLKVARTKKPSGGLGRSKSTSQTSRAEPNPKTQRKSLDLAELGRARSLVVKKPAPPLISMRNGLQDDGSRQAGNRSWAKDGQKGKYQQGRTTITVTPAEITALAILLGSEPNRNVDKMLSVPETGAYGISIVPTQTDGSKYHITLKQNKRNKSQQHARGSGVSPLFAKHLAAGSLPFSQDDQNVHSILIDDETVDALQAGASLYTHPNAARTPQSKFLASLPSSRGNKFHILAASTEIHTSTTLLDAIAALPFSGGLAPLASSPLIKTVQFIASGNLPAGKLLQRLEGLVDKVHRHSPQLDIFGPLYSPRNAKALYRERERLRKLATDPSSIPDTRADKTARMSRYTTLLERLMALVPDTKPHDVLDAVQQATRTQIKHSYHRALSIHAAHSKSATSIVDSALVVNDDSAAPPHRRSLGTSPTLRRRSNRSSLRSDATGRSSPSHISSSSEEEEEVVDDADEPHLARQLEHVLKAELPLDVQTIAFVARMVLVAWTLSVDSVVWGDGKKDEREAYRVPDLAEWDKMVMS